jgi:hypothetical protein
VPYLLPGAKLNIALELSEDPTVSSRTRPAVNLTENDRSKNQFERLLASPEQVTWYEFHLIISNRLITMLVGFAA